MPKAKTRKGAVKRGYNPKKKKTRKNKELYVAKNMRQDQSMDKQTEEV